VVPAESNQIPVDQKAEDLGQPSFTFWLLLALLLAVLAELTLYGQGVYAISADSSARILDAFEWTRNSSHETTHWPPGYRVIVGTVLKFWPDLFMAPRAITFLFGLLTIGAVAWLADRMFHDRRVTAATAIIGAILPERVVLSLVPLAEIIFVPLVVVGCILLWEWIGSPRSSLAVGSALCMALASGVRYEGWFFAGAFLLVVCVVVVTSRPAKGLQQFVIVAVIVSAFPCIWIILHLVQHGNLGLITDATGARYRLLHGDSFTDLLPRTLPVQFVVGNLRSANLVGVISLVALASVSRRTRQWLFVPGAAFAVLSILAIAGWAVPSHEFWRPAAVWSVLLVPFTAHWLIEQRQFARTRPWLATIALFVLAAVIAAACWARSRDLIAHPEFGRHELAIAQRLDRLLTVDQDARVLIDTSTVRYIHVVVASQHTEAFVLNTGADPRAPIEAELTDLDLGVIDLDEIRRRGIRYLVIRHDRGRRRLRSRPGLATLDSYGPWSLYEAGGHGGATHAPGIAAPDPEGPVLDPGTATDGAPVQPATTTPERMSPRAVIVAITELPVTICGGRTNRSIENLVADLQTVGLQALLDEIKESAPDVYSVETDSIAADFGDDLTTAEGTALGGRVITRFSDLVATPDGVDGKFTIEFDTFSVDAQTLTIEKIAGEVELVVDPQGHVTGTTTFRGTSAGRPSARSTLVGDLRWNTNRCNGSPAGGSITLEADGKLHTLAFDPRCEVEIGSYDAARVWDFSYAFSDHEDIVAGRHVEHTSNVEIWEEASARYWKPQQGGVELEDSTPAVVTFRFKFERPVSAAHLDLAMPTFHWTYSRGHNFLYGSVDGTSWQMLMEVPPPAFGGTNGGRYRSYLPKRLTGAREIWLLAELYSYGTSAPLGGVYTNSAQLARHEETAGDNAFRLDVRLHEN
jgi:hypothetical protein